MTVSPATRALVIERAAARCESCGSSAQFLGWSQHHRRPRGAGGTKRPETNQPANLLLLCGSGTTGDHGFYESHRELAFEHGVLVRQNQDPSEVPVLYRGAWVLLDNDGSVTACESPLVQA